MVRIAFIYIAEAYQAYHAAAAMFDLMQRDGVEVDVFHIDDTVPEHLDLLARAHGAAPVTSHKLDAGLAGRAIQSVKLLGLAKPQVLAHNRHLFERYDALVSTEDGIVRLFSDRPVSERPLRILITHGVGMRHLPSAGNREGMDLIIAKGEGDVEQWHTRGDFAPGRIVAGGYPKLASASRLSTGMTPLFDNDNPTVLYNPHKEPRERSWDRFFPALLEGFRKDRSRNLIVAPHVKMFRRRSESVRAKLRALSDDTILVDPGSHRSLDNSYTETADIYVGDVSSQVVEFLARPRPCVFLNAHGASWQGNPNYALWQFGEVVDRPEDVMDAIARAPQLHPQFAQAQMREVHRRLGDSSEASIVQTADLIHAFIAENARP